MFNSDILPDYIYRLGKTFDPDVDKWYNDFRKSMEELFNSYKDELIKPLRMKDII